MPPVIIGIDAVINRRASTPNGLNIFELNWFTVGMFADSWISYIKLPYLGHKVILVAGMVQLGQFLMPANQLLN